MSSFRNHTVKRLWRITEQYNTLHPENWSDEVAIIIQEYQVSLP